MSCESIYKDCESLIDPLHPVEDMKESCAVAYPRVTDDYYRGVREVMPTLWMVPFYKHEVYVSESGSGQYCHSPFLWSGLSSHRDLTTGQGTIM